MMNTNDIKKLIDRYFAGETTLSDERTLSAYFNQPDVDKELLPYAAIFRQFVAEKQADAPVNATDKLKAAQRKTNYKHNSRIQYIIYLGVAAALFLFLTLALPNNKKDDTKDYFVMYVNGERINDQQAALEFTAQQFEKITATFSKTNEIAKQPLEVIRQSLKPLQTTNKQLNKVEEMFSFLKQNK